MLLNTEHSCNKNNTNEYIQNVIREKVNYSTEKKKKLFQDIILLQQQNSSETPAKNITNRIFGYVPRQCTKPEINRAKYLVCFDEELSNETYGYCLSCLLFATKYNNYTWKLGEKNYNAVNKSIKKHESSKTHEAALKCCDIMTIEPQCNIVENGIIPAEELEDDYVDIFVIAEKTSGIEGVASEESCCVINGELIYGIENAVICEETDDTGNENVHMFAFADEIFTPEIADTEDSLSTLQSKLRGPTYNSVTEERPRRISLRTAYTTRNRTIVGDVIRTVLHLISLGRNNDFPTFVHKKIFRRSFTLIQKLRWKTKMIISKPIILIKL